MSIEITSRDLFGRVLFRSLGVRTSCMALLFVCVIICALQMNLANASTACPQKNWPLWEIFKANYIRADGRVIAGVEPQFQSFSEGQSYAMFFSLIANDPSTFEILWRWSKVNLANNDIENNLPAWTWGKSEDGTWKILDQNSASDADLWYVYNLLEAGRIWHRTDYTADANKLIKLIEAKSIVTLPGLGKMLLPGPFGFSLSENEWQLNPSYLPIPILRRLTLNNKNSPWSEIAKNTGQMLRESSPRQLTPNWINYRKTSNKTGGFILDSIKGDDGSYDAIRVYLWAGMTSTKDPLSKSIMHSSVGMEKLIEQNGMPPEHVNTVTGKFAGIAPLGFSSALLPYLSHSRKPILLNSQLERVQAIDFSKKPPIYYDFVLSLFGIGWNENRYRFESDGLIKLHWNLACAQ